MIAIQIGAIRWATAIGTIGSFVLLLLAVGPSARQPDVPPIPSAPEVVSAIVAAARLDSRKTLVDLGCGDGRIALAAAKTGARSVCVERDRAVIESAISAAKDSGVSLLIDFKLMDLREYVRDRDAIGNVDVVVLYLSPEWNQSIATDLQRHLKPSAIVISSVYAIANWMPREVIPVKIKTTGNTSPIYIYEMQDQHQSW